VNRAEEHIYNYKSGNVLCTFQYSRDEQVHTGKVVTSESRVVRQDIFS